MLKRSWKGYNPVARRGRGDGQGGIHGGMTPPSMEGSAKPSRRRREPRSAGGGFLKQWRDPDGLNWDYAWDFSLASAAADSDIPNIEGGIDLSIDSGAYSEATGVAGFSMRNYNLSADKPKAIDTATFSASIPNLVASGPVHIRILGRLGATSSRILEIGDTAGRSIQVNQSAAGTVEVVVRDATPTTVVSQTASASSWVVVDILIQDASTNTRIDIYVNDTNANAASGSEAFPGITDGSIDLSPATWDGDLGFIGIRRALVTAAQHTATYNRVIQTTADTTVFGDAYTWYMRFTCENADGSTWTGDGTSSPPSLNANTTQTTNGDTTGLNTAGLGAARVNTAVEAVESGGEGGYASTSGSTQVGSTGWPTTDYTIRMLVRAVNTASPALYRWRSVPWSTGSASIRHRNGTTMRLEHNSGSTSLQVLTGFVHGGNWALIDIFIDITNDQVIFRQNGTETTYTGLTNLDATIGGTKPLGDLGLLTAENQTLTSVGDRLVGFGIVLGDIGKTAHDADVLKLGL